jgi:predicted MFS family arabinose efflux permease
MAWFPAREQPYINSFYNVFSFIAMAAAFGAPGALLALTHNWGAVLSCLACTAVAALIAWLILGRNPPVNSHQQAVIGAEHRIESGILLASRRKEVWLLTGAMIGQMWAFNTFSTYLPAFLETERGLSRVEAGGMSSILPLAGMAGALICGIGAGLLGRRKPFLWPLMVLALGAGLVIVNGGTGPAVYTAIAAFGFATAGLSPPLMTVVMDLRGATTEFIGGAFALIYGVSFTVSFFVSPAFGALAPIWGSRSTMAAFSLPLILSIVTLVMLPETGPRRRGIMKDGAATEVAPPRRS